MSRIDIILLIIVLMCAYSTITARYKTCVLFGQLAQQAVLIRSLDAEYTRLQLEQSTHILHVNLLQQIAHRRLGLTPVERTYVLIIPQ